MGNIESGEMGSVWEYSVDPNHASIGSSRYSYNIRTAEVDSQKAPSSSSSSSSFRGTESISSSRRISQRFNILSNFGEWSSRRSQFYTLDHHVDIMEDPYNLHYCRYNAATTNNNNNNDNATNNDIKDSDDGGGGYHNNIRQDPSDDGSNIPISTKSNNFQKTMSKVAPDDTTAIGTNTASPLLLSRIRDLPSLILFLLHIAIVSGSILFVGLRKLKTHNDNESDDYVDPRSPLFQLYPELASSVLSGIISGILLQTLFRSFPSIMAHSIAWISSVFTIVTSLFLIIITSTTRRRRRTDVSSTTHTSSLWVGIVFLVFALVQCIYALFITRTRKSELKFAGDLLYCSHKPRATLAIIFLSILGMAATWQLFWCLGLVSVMSIGPLFPLVIVGLFISIAWTMETMRNVVIVATARRLMPIYNNVPRSNNTTHNTADDSIVTKYPSIYSTIGSISLGSFIVPFVHVLNIMARAVNGVMFVDNVAVDLGAHSFYEATQNLSNHANQWSYVLLGVHRKTFLKASKEASNIIANQRLDVILSTDLTCSFCMLSGICGGMICVLVSGAWTYGTHQTPISSISIVSFFLGYLLVRLIMASTQASVMTHYICFAQNPSSHELLTSPVPERLKELLANIDIERTMK